MSENLRACRRGDGSCRGSGYASYGSRYSSDKHRVAYRIEYLSGGFSLNHSRHHRCGGAYPGGDRRSFCRKQEQRRCRSSRKDGQRSKSRDYYHADNYLDYRLPVLDDKVLDARPYLLRHADDPVDRLFEEVLDRLARFFAPFLEPLPSALFLGRRRRYSPRIGFVELRVQLAYRLSRALVSHPDGVQEFSEALHSDIDFLRLLRLNLVDALVNLFNNRLQIARAAVHIVNIRFDSLERGGNLLLPVLCFIDA